MIIEVSERNLLTLLAQLKLTGHGAIYVPVYGAERQLIEAIPDAEKYHGRQPGPMPPAIEDYVLKLQQAIRMVREQPSNNVDYGVCETCGKQIVHGACVCGIRGDVGPQGEVGGSIGYD